MAELMKENEVSFYIGDRHIQPYGTGGGSTSEITEITQNNIEDAVKATTSVTVKGGHNAQNYNSEEEYYLFYARINGNEVELPTEFIDNFVIAGIPFVAIDNRYKYFDGEYYNNNMPFINTNSDTFIINMDGGEVEFTYYYTIIHAVITFCRANYYSTEYPNEKWYEIQWENSQDTLRPDNTFTNGMLRFNPGPK